VASQVVLNSIELVSLIMNIRGQGHLTCLHKNLPRSSRLACLGYREAGLADLSFMVPLGMVSSTVLGGCPWDTRQQPLAQGDTSMQDPKLSEGF
jgi:hypothetical protein